MTHRLLDKHGESIWIAVGALAVALGLAIAATGAVGVVAGQWTSPTAEVPGLDAGETGNITVAVEWNGNATANDTATIEIDYVTNASTGTLEQTDTHTMNASTSNTTEATYEVSPDQDVELFEVTVEAVEQNVSSVTVDSDIQADSGAGGGGLLDDDGQAIVGVVVLAIVGVVAVARREA